MEERVAAITDSSQPPEAAAAATAAVLAALRSGSLNVLGLVAMLRQPLTDDTQHEGRADAVRLLSQVVSEVPEALKPGDPGVLAEFLGGKLRDWRCVTEATPGCLALLRRHDQQPSDQQQQQQQRQQQLSGLAPLPEAAALRLVEQMLGVHVPALDYRGRLACYQLLLEVVTGPFGAPAAAAGSDLVNFTVVAMEGEADPRCLMVALQCVQAVAALYSSPTTAPLLSKVSHLEDSLEDLFEVGVVPYFPMIFTPPKSDPTKAAITREGLLTRVIDAMAACPQFAPLAIPLLSEKLGSSLKQAKEDALTALPACLGRWGAAAVRSHLQAVWLMLKAELMAPAAADGLMGEQLAARSTTAGQAASVLRQCVAALGPGVLDSQVLQDVAVDDLNQYLGLVDPPWAAAAAGAGAAGEEAAAAVGTPTAGAGAAADDWQLPDRAQKRLPCIAGCVAAVLAAGGRSCDAACAGILQPAVAALLHDTAAFSPAAADPASASSTDQHAPARPLQASSAVLCLLHHCLGAVAEAAAADQAAAAAGAPWRPEGPGCASLAALVPSILGALGQLQQLASVLQQQRAHLKQQQQQSGEPSSAAAAAPAAAAAGPLAALAQDVVQVKQLQLWLPLVLQDVLSLPVSAAGALGQQQLELAARQLMQLALAGSSLDSELELQPGLQLNEQDTAAAALVKLASWPPHLPGAGAAAAPGAGMQALSGLVASTLLPLLQQQTPGSTEAAAPADQRRQAMRLLWQLAGSSAAAAWQVLVWLQPLVLQHVRQGAWADLCVLLPILHGCCLPTLPADLGKPESQAAAAFANTLLDTWKQHEEQQQNEGGASSSAAAAARLHACLFLAHLTARCSLADQRSLLLPACEWVTDAAATATAAGASPMSVDGALGAATTSQRGRPACLALAVLAGARPGLLTAPSTCDLLASAAQLVMAPTWGCSQGGAGGGGVDAGSLDSTLAAVVIAGVTNKGMQAARAAASSDAQQAAETAVAPLLSAVNAILGAPLEQQQQQPATMVAAVRANAWLARALAMQRHTMWESVMRTQLLWPLCQRRLEGAGGTQASETMQLWWAAAASFGVLVAEAPPGASASSASSSSTALLQPQELGLQLSLHMQPRPLWQQRVFEVSLSAVQDGIAAASQHLQHERWGLWLAASHLLAGVPLALLARGQHELVLLQTLVQLQDMWQACVIARASPAAEAAEAALPGAPHLAGCCAGEAAPLLQLMHACLLRLGGVLAGSGGAEPYELHVEVLMAVLCALARVLPPAPAADAGDHPLASTAADGSSMQPSRRLVASAARVRKAALSCATACTAALPYHLLHRHRQAVLAAATAALDDDRRAVRRAAVACKAAWTGGSPAAV